MTTTMRTTSLVLLGFATGVTIAACARESTVANPNHCANQTGDDWCAARYEDGSRPFCILGNGVCGTTPGRDGCVDARPAEDECYSPCGSSMTVVEDASCLPGGESTGTEGSSTTDGVTETSETGSESGTSSTTGPMPCTLDEECTDDAAPFCDVGSGECVACDGTPDPDAACAGVDPGLPLCVGGACVACTPENPAVCEEQLLICDGDSNTCVPCDEHAECGSGACELAVGRCFLAGDVVHVDGDGGQDFLTVAAAVMDVAPGGHGVIVVHQQDSGLGYPSVLIDGGKTIALLVAPGESPSIQGTGGNPGLRVEGAGAALYVDGVHVVGNTMGLGMRVNGALAWVDRSRIVQNSGGGVVAENGAELVLRNCFATGSGNGISAVSLADANVSILYSTAFSSAFAATAAVECSGATTLSLRNSIVVTQGGAVGNELACPGSDVSYSATEALIGGEGNVSVGLFPDGTPEQWFVDVIAGDLGLQNQGLTVFADVAQWQAGDPPTDIEGDARPAADGAADYAGADVP